MKRGIILGTCIVLMGVLLDCETANGITKDVANTARNIRDILGVGRDIGNISK